MQGDLHRAKRCQVALAGQDLLAIDVQHRLALAAQAKGIVATKRDPNVALKRGLEGAGLHERSGGRAGRHKQRRESAGARIPAAVLLEADQQPGPEGRFRRGRELAEAMGMRRAIVPYLAGNFSAVGLILSPLRWEVSRMVQAIAADLPVERLAAALAALDREARDRLAEAGFDPTVVVGGRVRAFGANARLGQGEFLVAEADESDGSFLKLTPTIAVVTTIDAEHLDYYRDLHAIRETFLQFINKVPFSGVAVLCADQPEIQALLPRVEKRVISYGLTAPADLVAAVEQIEQLLLLVVLGKRADIDGVFRNFGRSVLGDAHKGMRQPFLDPFLRDAAVRGHLFV